jgi:hypothetical protein
VEVCDEGSEDVPHEESPELLDTSGRGLQLVDALATRWGTRRNETTCVWFELEQSGAAA